MRQKKLFGQFPPVTTKEWMDKINSDLKGADFNKRLVWHTREGFDVMPFYRREDISALDNVDNYLQLYLKGYPSSEERNAGYRNAANSWLIRQDVHVGDYKAANKKALSLLTNGVSSLGFLIESPESISEENFSFLLDGIDLTSVEINFLSEGKAKEIIGIIGNIAGKTHVDNSVIKGAVEADPLGRLMLNGLLCIPVEAGMDYLASLTEENLRFPSYRNIHINGSNFSNSGAGPVMELAMTLSMAVEYLSQLTERGIRPADAASKIRFGFGIGSGYFMEIAKLRAARILWSLIGESYGEKGNTSFRMEIHSVTSKWNTTVYEPYVNMLRSQTEAMSAILGGTDSLTVNPFDTPFAKPGEFSERIARNQQLILKEEAFFDKVADPSSGSYYIETLTSLVADNAWKLFTATEETGGFLDSLKEGKIQEKLSTISNERGVDIGRRKEILLGTNLYPDPDSRSPEGYKSAIRTGGNENQGGKLSSTVRLSRGSEELEKIRTAVENAAARPVVFLLSVGNHGIRRARAQFSSGFFGSAGYKIIENEGYDIIEEGLKEAQKIKADIIVVCSSDEEYTSFAPVVKKMVGDKAIIVIAGNPPLMDELKAMGVSDFISVRSKLVETLKYYNSRLGITE